MNIDEKKVYIYKNINNIKYHNEIISYIIDNDIKYTENNNGFFINISLIDEHINNIYNILKYILSNNIENDNYDLKKNIIFKNDIINNIEQRKYESTVNENKIYNIPLSNFKKSDQQLIIESKKFDN